MIFYISARKLNYLCNSIAIFKKTFVIKIVALPTQISRPISNIKIKIKYDIRTKGADFRTYFSTI